MAPPEVQSTDPAAAPQHPHDHAGSRMSRSRARLRACATAYDSIVVQQISLLNVVEGFLERQRSCSIHLSRRMRPPGAVTGGPQRVCMTVRKKGSHMESWRELAEDWGTLGQ